MNSKIVVVSVCLVLESIALLFMLAGVGALQNICGETDQDLTTADMTCHTTYRYQWWLVVFNAAVQVGVVLSIITDTLKKYRTGICSILAVLTVMLMDNANEFLALRDKTSGALADRAAVFTAGCVLAAMMHLALIIAFGKTHSVPRAREHAENGPYKTYENQMAERPAQEQQTPLPAPLSYPPV